MLFLLPPSETKLDGGSGASGLDLPSWAFPELAAVRGDVISRLLTMSADAEGSMRALKIGPRLASEVERNRALATSPSMRALERYTGVLYDPIRAGELDEASWRWASRHVLIHSALFGPLRATDLIPAYRLSHDSRLPGASLRSTWSGPVAESLASVDAFVVDLRSEGYVGLGPVVGARSTYLRVVADDGGRRRALNHFNKKSKGLLIAALLRDQPELRGLDDLVAWGADRGVRLEPGRETQLVSESLLSTSA
ncbi:hypothetical protein EDF38_1154 [Frigoribacterium sp. PhB160]|uniref:YaaA family protein n=1 Tax=Frigoribacterium sp. PhB160 TaxID=2485192 RepID=UPI000F494D05|nr:peroxide stress protein YaaA [Frigoribacterium sp. PhB160]ROS62052.1 hypothetical protein EDF38_1154 [Frigoribacterium sp. PhB160]